MGQRVNSQAKNETEHNAAVSNADHISEAEDPGKSKDIDASTDASVDTALGKRKRPQIEEADDTSYPLRPRTMATSLSTMDRNPGNHVEAMTAQGLEADERVDLSVSAGTSSATERLTAIEEFESIMRSFGWSLE